MSSARPSLGKLDAHLSFVPDDDEDEVVSPEPEPERSVADTKAEEKRITDIMSEAMDLNMMDMEVKFQQYESAGPLAEEYATAAINIEAALLRKLTEITQTSEIVPEDERHTWEAVLQALFKAMGQPAPELHEYTGYLHQRAVAVASGVVRELEKEIRHGTQTAIIVSAAEIVKTMPAAGAPAVTKAAKATVSAKVEGLDAFCERTTLLHELSYGIFEQEGQVKAMRIQLSKLGAERHNATGAKNLKAETDLKQEIDFDVDRLRQMVQERNVEAYAMLGRDVRFGAMPDKKNEKAVREALKTIKELKLGDLASGAPKPTAAADLKDALVKLCMADIENMWALVPTIVRLKEHGIAGWSIHTNETMQYKAVENDERDLPDKLYSAIEYYAKLGYVQRPTEAMFKMCTAATQMEHAKKAKKASKFYIKQNGVLYDTLRSEVGRAVTDVVTGSGLFLGDRSEGRRVQAASGDAASILEAWLLQTETFGVFAKDDSLNGIMHAAGNLVMDDWKKGVSQFQNQVEKAKELKVELSYHQTVYKYLMKLRQHRPRVAAQLEKKWGSLPTGSEAGDNIIPLLPLFIGEFTQAMNDAVASDRSMNKSEAFKRDRGRMVQRVNLFAGCDDPIEDESIRELSEQTEGTEKQGKPKKKKKKKKSKSGDSQGGGADGGDGDLSQTDCIAVATFHSKAGGKSRSKPERSNHSYASWKDREEHMAMYAKDSEGKAMKCCDVGDGCSWKGCNHSKLSKADYQKWREAIYDRDQRWRKETNTDKPKVGRYSWAICGACKAHVHENKSSITMRDNYTYSHNGSRAGQSHTQHGSSRQRHQDSVRVAEIEGREHEERPDMELNPALQSSAPTSQSGAPAVDQRESRVAELERELAIERRERRCEQFERAHSASITHAQQTATFGAPQISAPFTGVDGRSVPTLDIDLNAR
jgi:hypothetical protein